MFQISFVLKMMAVILTVPVTGTIDLTPIDNTDGEWIASGYEVITELEFDPLEYVDNVQAAQAFFIDTDDGEKLRLILVGDNRVLVFDEPWETYREYTIEPPWAIGSVTFARNGKYLAISAYKDLTYNDGYFDWELKAYEGFRIEITEESILSEQFNSNPGEYFYFYYISNEGMIAGSNAIGVVSLYPQGDIDEFLSREYSTQMWNREGCSYDGSLIVLGNIPISNGTIGIQGYDWSGNLLWETPIGDRNLTGLRVSPSGTYVLASDYTELVCYSGEDGSELWRTAAGLRCGFPQISPDGSRWIISPDERGHNYFYSGLLNSSGNTETISASEILSQSMDNPVCLNVNDQGNSLFWIHNCQNAKLLRMIYLNSDQHVLWASGKVDVLTPNMRFRFPQATNTASYFRCAIAAVSGDGSRICYTDYKSIKVLRFEEVQ